MTNNTDKIYHLDVETLGENGRPIANTYGDLDIIAYVARKAEKLISDSGSQEASLTLVEVDAIGGANLRTVATLTADAETVGLVLKRRITTERRAILSANTTTQAEPSPTVDTQRTDGTADSTAGHTEF